MHNMAIALHKKGYQVTGSDDEVFEPSKGRLNKHGLLPDKMGWDEGRVTNEIDCVILGMHARKDNPELLKAQKLNLKIYSYPEYIFEQTKDKKRVVIGGSHGKTSMTAMTLHQAIRSIAPEYFNNIQHLSDKRAPVELKEKFMLITSWFESGQRLDLLNEMTQSDFENEINNVAGLEEKVEGLTAVNSEKSVLKEFLLTALAAYSLLERKDLKQSVSFQDYFSSVVGGLG